MTDATRPFSFFEWRRRNKFSIGVEAYAKYKSYLSDWYLAKKSEESETSTTQSLYREILSSLSLTYKSTAEENYLSRIDFTDEMDLSVAIPYIARAIKENCVEIQEQREQAIYVSLKNNLKGSFSAFPHHLKNFILSKFTKRNFFSNAKNGKFYAQFPNLEDVNKNFSVRVIEFYDKTNYLDLSDPILTEDDKFLNFLANAEILEKSVENFEKYLGASIWKITENYFQKLSNPNEYWMNSMVLVNPTKALIERNSNLVSFEKISIFNLPEKNSVSSFLSKSSGFSRKKNAESAPNPKKFGRITGRGMKRVPHSTNINSITSAFLNKDNVLSASIPPQNAGEFSGFSTKQENIKSSGVGIVRPYDSDLIFIGEKADMFTEKGDAVLNFRKQFNIDKRVDEILQWTKHGRNLQQDVFGINYLLIK